MTVTFSVFAGMYLLNIIFGVIENCFVNGAKFDGKKITASFLRIFMA
jgi:ABC-type sulfate transport system permease subunit